MGLMNLDLRAVEGEAKFGQGEVSGQQNQSLS